MPVELFHQRAEALAGGVEGDQGDPGLAHVGAGADLARDPGQDAFGLAHHEDLVRTAGAPGAVAALREECNCQVEHRTRRHAADGLFLEGGPLQFFVPTKVMGVG